LCFYFAGFLVASANKMHRVVALNGRVIFEFSYKGSHCVDETVFRVDTFDNESLTLTTTLVEDDSVAQIARRKSESGQDLFEVVYEERTLTTRYLLPVGKFVACLLFDEPAVAYIRQAECVQTVYLRNVSFIHEPRPAGE